MTFHCMNLSTNNSDTIVEKSERKGATQGRGGVPRAMSEVKSGSKKMAKSPGHGKMAKSPTYKSPGSKVKGKRHCVFCEQSSTDEDGHGKLLSKAGLSAHYFCMLFSSGLSQNGKSEKQGILGFLQEDIMKEVRRGSRLKCSYCRKNGATIGCVVKNCKKMFHLCCGRENGTLHQFFDTFSSYCQAHRPQQDVPSIEDPSHVCSICMTHVECKPAMDTLRAPCCRKAWYHRDCMQSYAKSAGLYFFKCPLCNNKEEFQEEMLTYGIYIPDQDASWETEPHAFQDLLERYQHCDAKVCKCAEGRKYDKEGSKWELLICDNCGSQGGHVGCHHLVKKGKDYICPECHEVDLKYYSPDHKKQLPKKKAIKVEKTEPDTEKYVSEYPGPSNRMKKTGLPKIVSTSPDGRGIPTSPQHHPSPKDIKPSSKKRKRLSLAVESESKVKKQKMVSPSVGDQKVKTEIKTDVDAANEVGAIKTEERRSSLEDFKVGTKVRFDKDKKKSKKRKSQELGASQKTLEGWLKMGTFKPKEKSLQDVDTGARKLSSVFTKRTPVKRPAVIEWRGIQLQIKSPRVLLKNNVDSSGNLKPRKLELNTAKDKSANIALPVGTVGVPTPSVSSGKALLADLDNDFRVTRNMVSYVDNVTSSISNEKGCQTCSPTSVQPRKSRKSENKSRLLTNSDELSEDELTPKSRESLLRSSGKKKQPVTDLELTPTTKERSCSDRKKLSVSDLILTPSSKELKNSGKKKAPVSNSDSKNFWTVSNNHEPLTPTTSASNNDFSLKGVLDENGNTTPHSKTKSFKKTCVTTPSSDKRLLSDAKVNSSYVKEGQASKGSEHKNKSPAVRNSPMTRSASKLTSQQEINENTSAKKPSPELVKATRSLNASYVNDKELNTESISNTINSEEMRNDVILDSESALLSSYMISSEHLESENLSLQLTPKRKNLNEDHPPKIRKSSKSLSELKSYKCSENENPKKSKSLKKRKRKSESNVKRIVELPVYNDECLDQRWVLPVNNQDQHLDILEAKASTSTVDKENNKERSGSKGEQISKSSSKGEQISKFSVSTEDLDLSSPLPDQHSTYSGLDITKERNLKSNDETSATDMHVSSIKTGNIENMTNGIQSPASESKHVKSDCILRSSPRLRHIKEKVHLKYVTDEMQTKLSPNTIVTKGCSKEIKLPPKQTDKPEPEIFTKLLNKAASKDNKEANIVDQVISNQTQIKNVVSPMVGYHINREEVMNKKTKATKTSNKTKFDKKIKTAVGSILESSLEELRKKFNSRENTCPNAQPLLNKSPRQGATFSERVPGPVMFGPAIVGNQFPYQYRPEFQGAKTISPGWRTSSYYSSLLASYARLPGNAMPPTNYYNGEQYPSPGSQRSNNRGNINPLLKLKPTVHSEKTKEVGFASLAEQMEKSADNFHTLSRSSSRSSDEYLATCPVGLSLSPSYVTRFRRSHSDSFEEKQFSGKNGSNELSLTPSVSQLPAHKDTAESLVDLGNVMSDDKHAMSEYYSSEKSPPGTRVANLDMDDIRPLTDINS